MQSTVVYRGSSAETNQRSAARQRRHDWSWAGLPITLALVLVAWQALVTAGGYEAFILPGPGLVAQRLVQELAVGFETGSLLWHGWATLTAALGGFSVALALGLMLGYTLAKIPWLERALAPVLAATQAVPVVAVAPLIILWVGSDMRSKLLVAAIVTFFPMLSSAVVALRGVPRELREMGAISGANGWQLLWQIELPLALPVLFSGIRTGLALATTGAVVGEFVAGRAGLGALLNIARGLFDTPLIFVTLVTLAALTLGFYLAAMLLERALIRWDVGG